MTGDAVGIESGFDRCVFLLRLGVAARAGAVVVIVCRINVAVRVVTLKASEDFVGWREAKTLTEHMPESGVSGDFHLPLEGGQGLHVAGAPMALTAELDLLAGAEGCGVENLLVVVTVNDGIDMGGTRAVAALAVDAELRLVVDEVVVPNDAATVTKKAVLRLFRRAHVADWVGVAERSRRHDPAVLDVGVGDTELAALVARFPTERCDGVAAGSENDVDAGSNRLVIFRDSFQIYPVITAAITGCLRGFRELPFRPAHRLVEHFL